MPSKIIPITVAAIIGITALIILITAHVVSEAVWNGYALGAEVGHERGQRLGTYIGRQECEGAYGYPPPAHGLDIEPAPAENAE